MTHKIGIASATDDMTSVGSATSNTTAIMNDFYKIDDIMLGRGKPLQKLPGNIWFRNLISQEYDKYQSSTRQAKTRLTREIVTRIRNDGRKFWRQKQSSSIETKDSQDGTGLWKDWIEIDDDEARKKVAFTFRTERRKRMTKPTKKTKRTKVDANSSSDDTFSLESYGIELVSESSSEKQQSGCAVVEPPKLVQYSGETVKKTA